MGESSGTRIKIYRYIPRHIWYGYIPRHIWRIRILFSIGLVFLYSFDRGLIILQGLLLMGWLLKMRLNCSSFGSITVLIWFCSFLSVLKYFSNRSFMIWKTALSSFASITFLIWFLKRSFPLQIPVLVEIQCPLNYQWSC